MIEKIITIGEKGQITVPRAARQKLNIHKGDEIKLVVMPSGTIDLEVIRKKAPEDKLTEFLKKMPRIDVQKAWKRIEKERGRSERF